MKKIILLLSISFGLSAQNTKIKYSQMENPATSSVNLGTQTFSVSTITGSVTIGTGTVAANTTSLGIVRVKQGSSWIDFGESSTGFAGLWINAATTSSANYVLNSDFNNVRLNAPNGDLFLRVGNANRMSLGVSNSYHLLPLRIGSTTTPSATLDLTGTFSCSSTGTITGGLVCNGGYGLSITSGSLNSGSNTNQIGNLRLLSSNAATLTTGNTGTVAVLSDAVMPYTFIHGATNPADGSTYYFGNSGYLLSLATSSGTITIPYNCTLVSWDYNAVVAGVIGSAETATLQIAGTTTVNLSSSITFSAAGAYQGFSGTGLSTNFNAGDRINAKLICPTWVTANPTSVYGGLTLNFVRRQ